MIVPATDDRISWRGMISFYAKGDYVFPFRGRETERVLYDPALAGKMEEPSGVRLCFNTDSRKVKLTVESTERMLASFDIVCDGEIAGSATAVEGVVTFDGLGANHKTVEIWLPSGSLVGIRSVRLDDHAVIEPVADSAPRWITYGSSITQCADASRPLRTWPALVARELGFNLTNLGYGGQCHLDPLVARIIRDRSADFISLCAGVNICGQASLNWRSYPANLNGFVQIIREKHPAAPIVIVSAIHAATDRHTHNSQDMSLQDYRNMTKDSVKNLRAAGDGAIAYIDGLELLGAQEEHLLQEDKLHPTDEGYAHIAARFIEKVRNAKLSIPSATPHAA